MSDLDALRPLMGRFRPPAYDDLVAVSRKRRRHSALSAAAAVSALVAIVTMAVASLPDGQGALQPANPAPTGRESPSTSVEWTPERFRAEGSPEVLIPPTGSGLSATQYLACSGTCDREFRDRALEVSQDGQSAVFEVRGLEASFAPVWVKVFDEDSVLVQDAENGQEGPVRYRLLHADGTAVRLQLVNDPAPAVPGPGVFVIDAYAAWSRGMSGRHDLYLVDDRAGTLRPLDVPQEIEWWGPNVDEFLWGGSGCRVTWQRPDGSFVDHNAADCQTASSNTDPSWNWRDGFADWLEPGRMALVEWSEDGPPLVVHASMDRGASWERIEIKARNWGDTSSEIADALADALRQLD